MALGSINYIVCPNCGEIWQQGQTQLELMNFLRSGIYTLKDSKMGKFERVKCFKCKTKYDRKRLLYLIQDAA